MTDSDRIRVEVVVDIPDGENAGDVGVRAKMLLLGQDTDAFSDVSLRRFRYVDMEETDE